VVSGVKTDGPDRIVVTLDCHKCDRTWTHVRASQSLKPIFQPIAEANKRQAN
jgi:predicted acylesterase/phospholipase RssA